jgi:serine/threonine-protein kinase
MTDNLIGQEVEGYTLEELIGRGGNAAIYRATDAEGHTAAVKMLNPSVLGDDNFMARFNREVETTAALDHPHIITIHAHGVLNDRPYIIMGYYPKGSLQTRLNMRGPLGLHAAVRYMGQVAEALDYAHKRGIIHRDVKPGNILLDANDQAILSDFGVAKILNDSVHITADSIVGTSAYLAPELVELQAPVTVAVDIYSLGAMTFQLLTGRLPFEAGTPMATMWAHVNDPVPNVSEVGVNLPASLDLVIHKAMAKAAMHRYVTAADLVTDLEAVYEGERPTIADAYPPPTKVISTRVIPGRIEDAIKRVMDQVVKIRRPNGGSGSGILVEGEQVLTSLHVVDGALGIYVQFHSGEIVEAELIAADRTSDLGLLRLKATPESVDANTQRAIRLEFRRLEPGERLAAIGHPIGLDWSVTGGHYNALRRPGEGPLSEFGIKLTCPLVQVDVSINPGNSGGPVIDSAGRLVGLAVSIINPAVVNNIGFAVHGPIVADFWRANRGNTEPLYPYTDGRHHPAGLSYSPTTGKPIRMLPTIPLLADNAPAQTCTGCTARFQLSAPWCPHCGKPAAQVIV